MSATGPHDTALNEYRIRIAGMDCASCARTIESGISELPGVERARVNFATETLEARGRIDEQALRERIARLGYRAVATEQARAAATEAHGGFRGFIKYIWRQRDTRAALCGGLAVLASWPVAAVMSGTTAWTTAVQWAVIALAGYPIAIKGLRSLLYARRVTIDLLMTAATIGAVGIGATGEAVTVVLLFTLGEALEAYCGARSRDSLRALLDLQPETATVVERAEHAADGNAAEPAHAHYAVRPVSELRPGDRILVKPGERIAADGLIVEGTSSVDEAAITGESLPVARGVGQAVSAGTINRDGTLEIEVERTAENFTIARIARLVAEAQAERSPTERFVDRFAAWYTPAVVALAVLVAAAPPLLFGQPFMNPPDGSPGWLYRGLALLIVACPCALIISIPVTMVSALTRMATLGILVKGAAQLTALAEARVFAFDKTGTLTYGKPRVSGLRSMACEHQAASLEVCAPCDELVATAAAVELGSGHPLAHAVLHVANERRIERRYPRAAQITDFPGRGVTGTVNGRRITVGHEALFGSHRQLQQLLAERSGDAGSVMLVGDEDDVMGFIEVSDELRADAAAGLEALRDLDSGFRFVMLTGDREEVAAAVAAELGGFDEVRAALLPDHKLTAVKELEQTYGAVAMVGDGINDTPALAGAKLGIALGDGASHQAIDVANVVLMGSDLGQLARAVAMSRKAARVVRENIALSLGLKLIFLALAIPGLATLWMAVVADVGTTLLVTLNGMRMLRAR